MDWIGDIGLEGAGTDYAAEDIDSAVLVDTGFAAGTDSFVDTAPAGRTGWVSDFAEEVLDIAQFGPAGTDSVGTGLVGIARPGAGQPVPVGAVVDALGTPEGTADRTALALWYFCVKHFIYKLFKEQNVIERVQKQRTIKKTNDDLGINYTSYYCLVVDGRIQLFGLFPMSQRSKNVFCCFKALNYVSVGRCVIESFERYNHPNDEL